MPLYPAGLRGVDQVNKTLYVNMTLYRVREFKPGVFVCATRARLKAALSVCHLVGAGKVSCSRGAKILADTLSRRIGVD